LFGIVDLDVWQRRFWAARARGVLLSVVGAVGGVSVRF